MFCYTSELTSHYLIKYFEFSSYRLVFIVSKMEIYRIYLWGNGKYLIGLSFYLAFPFVSAIQVCNIIKISIGLDTTKRDIM